MTTHLTKLHKFIVTYYSLEELNILCFELSVEFENLGGRTRNIKARELILHLGREQHFGELFTQLQTSRPRAFKQEKLENNQEVFLAYYSELDAFQSETQPLAEKILGRVGLEQRAGFVSVILIIIFAITLLYFGLRITGPDRMTGDFNIAVAPFEVISDDPERDDPKYGEDVANSIYGRLHANFEELDTPIIHVWGPEEPRLNPVPLIKGGNPEERAIAAEKLAQDINADIVIYGVVNAINGNWEVVPEFFVSAQNFQEAAEILGQYNIGAPFEILGDDPRALRITAGDELRPRSEILAQLAIGLTYYSVANYDRAFEELKELAESEIIANSAGADVVYIMLGNTLSKQAANIFQNADRDNPNSTHVEQINSLLGEAIASYEEARKINPDSARPYSGKGSATYLLALTNGNPADKEQLLESIRYLHAGVLAQDKPPNSHVETKLHMNLGQSYLLLRYLGEVEDFEPAIKQFNQVIADYEGLTEPKSAVVRELAGDAHARLGLIYMESGDIENAILEYTAAISLLYNRPERQKLYQARVDKLQNR